jgi:hypothetical protein
VFVPERQELLQEMFPELGGRHANRPASAPLPAKTLLREAPTRTLLG